MMNKKEKAALEAALTDAALRSTYDVEADVGIPDCSVRANMSIGYAPIAACSDMSRVEEACSSSVSHGIGSQKETRSQQPMRLWSTRLRALQALRWRVERDCAKRLRRVDRAIEKAKEDGT